MNTVGPDKRLQYYRQPGAAVLASLRSHTMGLTNAAAERRIADNGLNAIANPTARRQWRAAYGVAALLLFDTVLAGIEQDPQLSLTFFALAILSVVLGQWEARRDAKPAVEYSRLLPARAKVLRNGDVHTVHTRKLAVGDIVQLEAGDRVPADLRLLTETGLIIDDATLLGGSTHTRKFAHAIRAAVPLLARNNLAFAGTTVVRGHASGLVIATGMQTELGRLSALDSSARQARIAQRRAQQNPHRWLNATAAGVFLIFLALAWQAGATPDQTLQLVLMLLAAFVPFGILLANHFLVWQAEAKLAARDIRATPRALRQFDKVDMLFVHDRLIAPSQFTATTFMIGRATYSVGGTGHHPIGEIRDSKNHPLNDQQLGDLALFFTAGPLTAHTTVTNHPKRPDQWQVRGDALEASLITLARKAHLSVEDLSVAYESIVDYPYDHGRGIASSIRLHEKAVIVLVRGTPEAVLNRSQKIWDHGHTRTMSVRDRERFAAFAATEGEKDHTCVALAYRTLPHSETPPGLEEAEDNLAFLGIVSCGVHAREAMIHLRSALPTSARIVRVSTHPYTVGGITSKQLRALSDANVLSKLESNSAHFAGLASEDLLRLIEVAKQAGHTVAMSGVSLNDEAALQRADVSLAGPASARVASQRAMVVLGELGISPLITLFAHVRALTTQRLILRRSVTADLLAALFVVCASVRSVLYANTPAALTAIEMLAAILLVQALPLLTLTLVAAPQRKHIPRSEVVWFAFATAVLTYGNFLAFFWRHGIGAAFIDASSSYYLQATTIALLTFVVCQWLHAAFEQHDGARNALGNLLMTLPAVGAAALFAITYLPAIQQYLGTRPLDITDWLSVILAVAIYTSFRLIQRHTRRHTRAAIIQLLGKAE